MTTTNITDFRKNIFAYMEQAVKFNDTVNVTTKNGSAIIMSEDDYNNIMETLYIKSIPGLSESIIEAAKEPLEDGVRYNEGEEW